MNKSHLFLFALNIVSYCGTALGTSTPISPIYSMITKSVYYTQIQSNQLVLDPVIPYEFKAWANYSTNLSAPILNASLSGAFGSTQMEKAASLTTNTIGVMFAEYFTNKADMDSSFANNQVYSFNVAFATTTNKFANYFNTSITYAPTPIISTVSNCAWIGSGYIMVLDPSKPFTISWPGNNVQSIISIESGGNSYPTVQGFTTNLSGKNQFTFSTTLINSLPRGAIIPVSFEDWINPVNAPWGNSYNSFNSFGIFIPPTPFQGNPFVLGKTHVLMQTNSTPFDYSPNIGTHGTYYGIDYGPYSFTVTSPLPCSIILPNNKKIATVVNGSGYNFTSGGLTKSALDTVYPNGIYKISTGQSLMLSVDSYPTIPSVLEVNGQPAEWQNGYLLLRAGKSNTISWTGFSDDTTFQQCGFESYDLNCTDWGNLASGGNVTNATICPALGLTGNNVTSITLEPSSLQKNVNYVLTLKYSEIISVTNQPVISGAIYSSEVIVPIIAQ